MPSTPRGGRPPRLARRRRTPAWHLLLSGLLVAVAVAAALYVQWRERPPEPPPPPPALVPPAPATDARQLADSLYAGVGAALGELGIGAELVTARREGGLDHILVRVPADLPLAEVNLALTRFVEQRGGQVHRAFEREGARVEIHSGFGAQATTLFALRHDPGLRRRTGQIAIVLDNFGHTSWGDQLLERFCALPQPLTLAILSAEGRARPIAGLARSRGHEVLERRPAEPELAGQGPVRLSIDPVDERRAVEQKLWELAEMAARSGQAIGIGHDRENTLLALEAVLPRLESRGFRFVPLSRLLP